MNNNMESKSKTKNLAEDSFKLSIGDFGKKLLHSFNDDKLDNFDLLYNKENNLLKGKQGHFTIQCGMETLHIFYNVDPNKTPKLLNIRFNKTEVGFDGANQNIELGEEYAQYGFRPYFTCVCGKLCTVLYKVPAENIFKCILCSNIIYESQKLNKKTMNGLFYHTHRLLKLVKMEEKTPRTFYNGKYTIKRQRLMEKYKTWQKGVTKEMIDSAIYLKDKS